MFRFVVVGLAEMLLWLLCMIVSKSESEVKIIHIIVQNNTYYSAK